MEKTESIFKVIHYMYSRYDIRKLRYPTVKVEWHEYAYFKTLDEVECYLQHQAQMWNKVCEGLDHAATISVFPVTKSISSRRRIALLKLYEKCLKEI